MIKFLSTGFWEFIARKVLRNKIFFLLVVLGITLAFSTQWKHIKFSYTEANLLPQDHEVNLKYQKFLQLFGEEGNLIVLGTRDSTLFSLAHFNKWTALAESLSQYEEVSNVLSIHNIQQLKKNKKTEIFTLSPFVENPIESQDELNTLRQQLFEQNPFYKNIIYNPETGSIRMVVYMKQELVNTKNRKDFVQQKLIQEIELFEQETGIDIKTSGMPYVRTLNAQYIVDEIGLFVGLALLVTSLIFFLFFKSFRATLISLIVVSIGVMWSFGWLGLFEYQITVLTALIPPLVIVIGIPNCIFLINKYQQEVKAHGNKVKSLQRVITKVGNATLMTNVTTASGFATFILTESKLLKDFGLIASLGILSIFVLCLLIIPIIYTFSPFPKKRHLEHLNKNWINRIIKWMEKQVRHYSIRVYLTALILLILSMIGINHIKLSGSIMDDMPQNADFFEDILFFEKEFNGVLPLEIIIDTKRKRGVSSLSNLKRMAKLEELIDEIPELSRPVSLVSLLKYAKQAYYNNNPKYYQLPTSQENSFIMSYVKRSSSRLNLLKNFTDSTGRYARISCFIKDKGMQNIEPIEKQLQDKIDKLFPSEKYSVFLTGKAYMFNKGTTYLVYNLMFSLSLAILLIALFMAYLFRSFRMILISIIPNLLPLLITAGFMGYLGVSLKPSTILVFSIAFGISVDDTIHFLAKYRQELQKNKWRIKTSVYAALRETGVSMIYTSVVLFFGFSLFALSGFGGTVALGILVSITLLFAMLSNLILLPTLLISLERLIARKEVLKKPSINILAEENTKSKT